MTAREPRVATWRKSSYSGDQACVEVAASPGGVLVRDSKNPDGPMLAVSLTMWRAFLAAITPDSQASVSQG
jgi:hypothetical protein